MNAPTTRTAHSAEARNLHWLLDNLVDEVPGIRSVAVVSSDGLLLLSSDPGATTPLGEEQSLRQAALAQDPAAQQVPYADQRPSDGRESVPEWSAAEGPVPPQSVAGTGPPPLRRRSRAEHAGTDASGAAGARMGGSTPLPGQPGGPRGSSADLATLVSGLGSLTLGAAKLMDGGFAADRGVDGRGRAVHHVHQ